MELKVFKDTVAAYGGRWETRLELPVETEILIPDYLPAVFKIVKCLIEPVVMQNSIASARWQGEGYLRCTVYYQSDEAGTRLYRTEQKFPFEKSVELPAASYLQGPARLWGELEYCNCRAVSEHRIDLRGAYALCVAACAVQPCELIASLADCGIEQRTQKLEGCTCVAAEEKTYTASTTVPLPGAGETILEIGGSFAPQAGSIQTGQVNCKGELQMQVCYRPAGAEDLMVRQKEIPVQQTVELDGVAEGDGCSFWGQVLGCTLTAATMAEEETTEPTLTVTWKLHVEVWRAGVYMAVADAYSTLCQTTVEHTTGKLLQKRQEIAERVSAAVEDDLPDPTMQVKGCFVTIGAPLVAPAADDKEFLVLAGKGTAHVLCADERGELNCFDKTFAWQLAGRWPAAAGELLPHLNAAAGKVASSKSGDKLRVEVEIEVTGLLLQTVPFEAVGEVTLGEAYPDQAEGPALYLYYAAKGERIFDIAKRYHARAGDLAAANRLDTTEPGLQEQTTEEACLLIPAAL